MVRKLYDASPPLFITGWFNLALLAAMIAAAPFDHRLVMGINPWIKPIKFAISITIYSWTIAWLLQYLPRPQRSISWGVSAAVLLEIVFIAMQAARGTTSHYNNSTALNAVVFGFMGFAILVNTILIARMLWLFLRPVPLPRAVLLGVRLGLVMFLLASFEAVVMLQNEGHTVGIADGGPGLPLVNWSTRAGDLRIAHFVGLHALQILPLAAWIFGLKWPRQAVAGVTVLFVTLFAIFALTLAQALAGRPLITI